MIRSKKVKHYTLKELSLISKELTMMRDSLYKQTFIDHTEYRNLTKTLDIITSAKLKMYFKEQQKQGRLL